MCVGVEVSSRWRGGLVSALFRFAKLQFEIQFRDDFGPADFLGSRLRGGYGFGLLAQLCRRDDPLSCAGQPQRCECDYLRLFRPTRETLSVKPFGAPLGNHLNLPATFVRGPRIGEIGLFITESQFYIM